MKPIAFPEQTTVWAKNQPPYLPLPAWTSAKETITLWRLSWWERLRVLCTGKLWLRQLNFGRALQPQRPQVESPFVTAWLTGAKVRLLEAEHQIPDAPANGGGA